MWYILKETYKDGKPVFEILQQVYYSEAHPESATAMAWIAKHIRRHGERISVMEKIDLEIQVSCQPSKK